MSQPLAAWEVGWDGRRPLEFSELAALAGVSKHRLWADAKTGLLGQPEPRREGVRLVIYSAVTATRYLKQKRPSALVFSKPPQRVEGPERTL